MLIVASKYANVAVMILQDRAGKSRFSGTRKSVPLKASSREHCV